MVVIILLSPKKAEFQTVCLSPGDANHNEKSSAHRNILEIIHQQIVEGINPLPFICCWLPFRLDQIVSTKIGDKFIPKVLFWFRNSG